MSNQPSESHSTVSVSTVVQIVSVLLTVAGLIAGAVWIVADIRNEIREEAMARQKADAEGAETRAAINSRVSVIEAKIIEPSKIVTTDTFKSLAAPIDQQTAKNARDIENILVVLNKSAQQGADLDKRLSVLTSVVERTFPAKPSQTDHRR